MSNDPNVSRMLRKLDSVLRIVAPFEHPAGATGSVVTFEELRLPESVAPGLRGLWAAGLDRFAATIRGDETLVGRPVVAVAVERFLVDHAGNVPAASFAARATLLHELAHAATSKPAKKADDVREYRSWLRDGLEIIEATDSFSAPSAHGPDWWLVFVVLLARLHAVEPSLVPFFRFRSAADQYGYAIPSGADDWLEAVATAPKLLDCPLVDVEAIPCPALDELFVQAAETCSAAAP